MERRRCRPTLLDFSMDILWKYVIHNHMQEGVFLDRGIDNPLQHRFSGLADAFIPIACCRGISRYIQGNKESEQIAEYLHSLVRSSVFINTFVQYNK